MGLWLLPAAFVGWMLILIAHSFVSGAAFWPLFFFALLELSLFCFCITNSRPWFALCIQQNNVVIIKHQPTAASWLAD